MSGWTLKLPGALEHRNTRALVGVLDRWDALPVEKVLVMHVESQAADVLPHLAELFDLGVIDWSSGPPKDVLRQGVDRVRRQGVGGVLRAMLVDLGYPVTSFALEEQTEKFCDGTWLLDGTYILGGDRHWSTFMLVVERPALPALPKLRELWDVVDEWRPLRSRCVLAIRIDGALTIYRERP